MAVIWLASMYTTLSTGVGLRPVLLQDRLAKLAEHAAHADMVISAVAQHGPWIGSVAERLQGQAVRVLEAVNRMLDASKQ